MFNKILTQIKNNSRIIIHRHTKPDGDAIGSQIGLYYLIKDNFPEKEVYAVGDDARNLSFMLNSELSELTDDKFKDALCIVLDSGSPALVSDDRYKTAKTTARFDHHIFTEKYCDYEFIDSTFESCCGIITEFAIKTGLEITKTAAKFLYTGIVTDSGRFRYDNTNARTMTLAAKLLEIGVDFNSIFLELYSDTFENKKRKAEFLLKVRFTDKNVAYVKNTKAELDEARLDPFYVSRAMVNTMADIKGVSLWVNFTEIDGAVLAELRSSNKNINPIAVKYGGGGHAKASGATLKSFAEADSMLADLDELSETTNEF